MPTQVDRYNNTFRNSRRRVVAKAADYTCTAGDNGTLFTNEGAAAVVTFTLPAVTGNAGLWYEFFSADNDGIVVAAADGTIITFNDVAANSVALTTTAKNIGGTLKATCSGTSWLIQAALYDAGVAAAMTVTIVT